MGRVVYEVLLDVDADVEVAFREWLDDHVRQIVALPGFMDARLSRVDDPPALPGRLSLCVQYTLHDAAALDAYLRDHAPRMRADGQARFGGRFSAQRRVTSTLATFARD
ncbi:MAG TPA: DUF4286 family protein [Lysobacter sp.]